MSTDTYRIPSTGFLRLAQIIGDKEKGYPAILPLGRTTFLEGVKTGRYPQPVKLSERATAWRVEDILSLIEELSGGEAA